jgi:hypothetical protein
MRTKHEDEAATIDGAFRWRNFEDTAIHDGTLEECAEALGLGPDVVAWKVAKFGRCDANECVAWKPSKRRGLEWPTAEAE